MAHRKERYAALMKTITSILLYSALERLFRCALRGHGLPFQWLGGKHSIHSRYAGSGRRYDYATKRDV